MLSTVSKKILNATVEWRVNSLTFRESRENIVGAYVNEPEVFDDELAALEMTSSTCAIPARFVD